jgi:hypothetical protein
MKDIERLRDMLIGADEIARFVGITKAQVYHAARLKTLPIGKWSHKLIASRRAIARTLASAAARGLSPPSLPPGH